MTSATLEKRLREVLVDMPDDDVHALAAFAQFLSHSRQPADVNGGRLLSNEESGRIVAALYCVADLSRADGLPLSNRDQDRYLYRGD